MALALAGCGSDDTNSDVLHTRIVTLPNGQKIRAEVELTEADMQKGMMFRDSLARDRGMLFLHEKPGYYPYWMFQCKISLDIIWMDSDHRIVEISANTPPCPAKPCPNYGGHRPARYVLELAGGEAQRQGLGSGQAIEF